MFISSSFLLALLQTSQFANIDIETFKIDLFKNFEENAHQIHKYMLIIIDNIYNIKLNQDIDINKREDKYYKWYTEIKKNLQYANLLTYLQISVKNNEYKIEKINPQYQLNNENNKTFFIFSYDMIKNDESNPLTDSSMKNIVNCSEILFKIYNYQKMHLWAYCTICIKFSTTNKEKLDIKQVKSYEFNKIFKYLSLLEKTFVLYQTKEKSKSLKIQNDGLFFFHSCNNFFIEDIKKTINLMLCFLFEKMKQFCSNNFQSNFAIAKYNFTHNPIFNDEIGCKNPISSEFETYKKILQIITEQYVTEQKFLELIIEPYINKNNLKIIKSLMEIFKENDKNQNNFIFDEKNIYYINTYKSIYTKLEKLIEIETISFKKSKFIVALKNIPNCLILIDSLCKNFIDLLKQNGFIMHEKFKYSTIFLADDYIYLRKLASSSLKFIKNYKKKKIFLEIIVDVIAKFDDIEKYLLILNKVINNYETFKSIKECEKNKMDEVIYTIHNDLSKIRILMILYAIKKRNE